MRPTELRLIERLPYFMVPRHPGLAEGLLSTPTRKMIGHRRLVHGLVSRAWDHEAVDIVVRRFP